MTVLLPSNWITTASVSLLSILFSGGILFREITQRPRQTCEASTHSRKSKSLTTWPLIAIMNAPLHALCLSTQYVNGLCYFSWYFAALCLSFGGIATGFYQLARLRYCFGAANNSTWNRGYSQRLFHVMNAIGVFLFLNIVIFCLFCPSCQRASCGWNSEWEFEIEHKETLSIQISYIWIHCYLLVYIGWDVSTVALYISKIYALTKYLRSVTITINMNHGNKNGNGNGNNNDNYNYNRNNYAKYVQSVDSIKSVLNQLHKILICTLIYEMICCIVFMVRLWAPDSLMLVIGNILELPVCISYSYACFLMMDHNEKSYASFLGVIKYCKLHYLCCCYRRVVDITIPPQIPQSQCTVTVKSREMRMSRLSTKTVTRKPTESHIPTVINTTSTSKTDSIHIVFEGNINSQNTEEKNSSDGTVGIHANDTNDTNDIVNNGKSHNDIMATAVHVNNTKNTTNSNLLMNNTNNVHNNNMDESQRTTTLELMQCVQANKRFFDLHPECRVEEGIED